MSLILFGFKSCGKTTFGKKLAAKLALPFIDTDRLIEKLVGEKLSCRELVKQKGSAFFREKEREAVKSLIGKEKAVIALGGGTVLDPENVRILAKIGVLVYLRVDREALKRRLLTPPLPTYLDPKDPEGSFSRMYEERKEVYEHIPAVWVDVNRDEEIVLTELSQVIDGK